MQTSKIPRTWQLRASYIRMADGRIIQRPTQEDTYRATARKVDPVKQRRAASAPVLRRDKQTTPRPFSSRTKDSFLVTQLEMENALQNSEADDVFLNDSSLSEDRIRQRYRQRPQSAMDHSFVRRSSDLYSNCADRPRSSIVVKTHTIHI